VERGGRTFGEKVRRGGLEVERQKKSTGGIRDVIKSCIKARKEGLELSKRSKTSERKGYKDAQKRTASEGQKKRIKKRAVISDQ